MKPKTGLDPAVAAYIEKDPETPAFLSRLTDLLDYLVPLFEREHKSYLSIGIGCTGGKHRSVAIVEECARRLRQHGAAVVVRHRDIAKESQ